VARRRLRAVTGGDGCDGDRGDPRTSQVSPLAVVPVEVDGVASEVHLDPGETTPPDGGQLAIRPGVPGEAKRGDRPIALAPVLRAPEGSSHGPRCRPAVPTTGPGCWTLELRACPTWRDVPERAPKGSRRAGEPPRRPDVQPGRDPRQRSSPRTRGPSRRPRGDVCNPRTDGDGEVDDEAAGCPTSAPTTVVAGVAPRRSLATPSAAPQ
jgi:hypothetical protein